MGRLGPSLLGTMIKVVPSLPLLEVKLPRTIRLDPSDRFVFEPAAEPGEWAVSGAFLHADVDPDSLDGKQRTALRSGFLGVSSFGFSTDRRYSELATTSAKRA